MRRLKIAAVWVALFFGLSYMFASTKGGDELEGPADEVPTEEVALAQLVPAVAASDVETGTCTMAHRLTGGGGIVQMTYPGAPGELHIATLMLDASGEMTGYSETRQAPAVTTSVSIDVREGSGSVANIPKGGALMTTGRGTADEVLQSEALGVPARRIERMLARCGLPGETN